MVQSVDRSDVERWVEAYETLWRSSGTDGLAEVFAPDATYLPSPWATPVRGLPALAAFWEAEREGPDEPFTMTSRVLAVEGRTAVVRVEVDYARDGDAGGERWRDLWVLTFDDAGRCAAFEEWPFAPDQPDGHD
jgi:ketosteroid isomerase-like protein